ncbi:poly(A) RNA polymerase gld-2 homolog B-like isoform X6 [Frieseomelitta varia]|uniref:poly(A) RNA polymerase gld-2 homolog B-like isoform X6 n=1 Tax=Frieseomelitta varia TaxID=561572 RepID=UPI001CB68A2D|nr:poly(A) RNA polymerase gld-2 homolog B-like isoform X6 [Frieseomelitta varia]
MSNEKIRNRGNVQISLVTIRIMGGQQANRQCPSVQPHTMHIHGASAFNQAEYAKYHSDACPQNRHMIQTGSYPLELLMGVEIPSLRHVEYMQSNNNSQRGHWQRHVNTSNNAPLIHSPHLTFRPNNNGLANKKSNWYNKLNKRTSFRESYVNNEKYGSDSGFSSRSPTPNKHHADSSRTESSDERDSVISLVEQNMKKSHRVHPSNVTNSRVMQYGIISNNSIHQYYQNHQRSVNCYPTTVSTSRNQVQTYQNKRRYHSGRNSPPPQRLPRNKRYMGFLSPNYHMFPRYGIAPDRFLARSHLIEVTRSPDDLFTGSIWDRLSKDVWSKFMMNQQTETVYRNKMMLWRYLYVYIKTAFPKYGLFLVGSTMNGFGSDNSDVDMCLLVRHTEMDQRNEAIGHLEQILKCLRRCGGVDPPVLPCLHSLYEGKFTPHTDIHCIDIQEELDIPASVLQPKNRQPLGELFVEFFRYYVMFDFNQYAISVRLAEKIPIEECRRARSYKNDPHQWKYLCIEEPFDLTNTARSVYDPDVFSRIKHVFDCTYQNLKEHHDLARIFIKVDSASPYIVT